MSAGEAMDMALDRFLAARRDPAVPADLARRIVVSTAHLRQFDADDAVTLPPVSAAQVATPMRPAIRRVRWAAIPAGAAMAASLALAFFTQMPDSQGDAGVGSAIVAGTQVAALDPVAATGQMTGAVDVDVSPATVPADKASAAAVPTDGTSLAIAARGEVVAGSAAPAAQPSTEVVVPASAPVQLAQNWQDGDVHEFALAKNEVAPEPVYGPVLDQDRYGPAYGPSASSSSAVSLGIQGSGGMAPARAGGRP